MAKKISNKQQEQYAKNIALSFEIIAFLVIMTVILVLAFPLAQEMLTDAGLSMPVFLITSLIQATFFILCARGIRKHSKLAYYSAWPLLILVIFQLRLIGAIVAGFMIVWLVRSKKLFLK